LERSAVTGLRLDTCRLSRPSLLRAEDRDEKPAAGGAQHRGDDRRRLRTGNRRHGALRRRARADRPDEQNFDLIEAKPGAQALFGTDRFGRDVLSRVIYGVRVSLYVAVTSIGLAMVVGGALGLTAGYVGGLWGNAINLVMGAVTRKTGDPFGPPASSSIAPARVIGSGGSAPS
jgi:ABC-type dipeptide/oligopeptide/nickel transport system permease subunit